MTFFAAETLIVGRLHAVLGATVRVLTTAQLADTLQQAQSVPAVHVIYSGFSVDSQDQGHLQVAQDWLVVAVERNVQQPISGAAARTSSGALVDGIMKAMRGEEDQPFLINGRRPMAKTPPPPHYEAGFIYVPTLWAVDTFIHY